MLEALVLTTLLIAPPQGNEPVGTGPDPAPVPISWEFEFKFVTPRRIEVKLPGSDAPQAYWYMLYTVTNTSPTTQKFYPAFELVTEDLDVFPADMGVPPLVFNTIRERHRITHKYLVPPTRAIGDLRTGPDYARESVAIWPADQVNTPTFKIYVAGLSGEARVMRNPSYNPDLPETKKVLDTAGREREIVVNPRHFTLRKTLELSYTLAASETARAVSEPKLDQMRWIMR